jgi:hypothetical protein
MDCCWERWSTWTVPPPVANRRRTGRVRAPIAIDPDHRLRVVPQLLDQNDGPMLEGLKKLQGVGVHLPLRAKDYPDLSRSSPILQ